MRPGTWHEIPGTSARDVLMKKEDAHVGVWGRQGSASVINAGNGAAFDGQRLYFFGGGRSLYGGNEVYAFDLNSLAWKRLTKPTSPLLPDDANASCPGYAVANDGAQTAPTPGQTFDGFVHVPKENALYLWGSLGFCFRGVGGGPARTWRFDLETLSWQFLGPAGKASGVKTALNPKTGNPIVVFNREIMEFQTDRGDYRSILKFRPRELAGTAAFHAKRNEIILISNRGVRRTTLSVANHMETVLESDEISLPGIDLGQLGVAYDVKREAMTLWDGSRNVYLLDIEHGRIQQFPREDGAAPRMGNSRGVYSKWVYVPGLDVFVGYNNPVEGIWLYRPRPLADAGQPEAAAETLIEGNVRICPSDNFGPECDEISLQRAVNRANPGDIIVLAPGEYSLAARIKVAGIQIIGEPGAHLTGRAAQGKGALIVAAPDVLIEGIECSNIHVPDQNGACVRIEAPNTTLRNVYFHDNDQGVLGGGKSGYVLIENSRFERNGRGGRAHGVYISTGSDQLIFRHNQVLSTHGLGHGLKSRAASSVIENNVFAGLEGPESRAIDLPNGGDVVIRFNVFQKGPNSDNRDMLGIAREASKRGVHDVNNTLIEKNIFVFDQDDGQVLSSDSPGTIIFKDNIVVGSDDIGERTNASGNQFYDDRALAGLKPSPALPAPPVE